MKKLQFKEFKLKDIKLKDIKMVFLSAALFFAVTMPFREFFKVMEVTEVRPASALPPALGLMFGIPGALGCAVGNLAADFLSGYSPLLCVLGFAAQFVYGLFPVLMWNTIKRYDSKEPSFFRLNTVRNVMRYIAIVLSDSIIMAVMLGLIMQAFQIDPFFSTTTLMLLLNNFVFCMVLGIPIIILIGLKRLRVSQTGLSLNERFILIFLLLGVISAGLIGIFAYTELLHIIADPLVLWNQIYFHIVVDLFIFYLFTVIFLNYSEKNITVPIESISYIAKTYVNGGTEKKDSASIAAQCEALSKNRTETGVLADAFRKMVLDMDDYIDNLTAVTADRERIASDLRIAADIQADMLPKIFPPFSNRADLHIAPFILPAKEVGGDFYDFFFLDDEQKKIALVIADVSGKGVPAALFMVIAKVLIKNNKDLPCDEILGAVNNLLAADNNSSMFVTTFFSVLNIETGEFSYSSAGHNPPVLHRKESGELTFLSLPRTPPLAIFPDKKFASQSFTLQRGDTLLLYTDGVTEAFNSKFEMYDSERLLNNLKLIIDKPVEGIVDGLYATIQEFAGDEPQSDDITMLCCRYFG